jgi:hypothetical protein
MESLQTTKRTTGLAAALAFATVFAGCQAPQANDDGSAAESELVATNGLTMLNGLTMTNGLSGNGLSGNGLSGNGLTAQALVVNPLSTTGLTSSTYLMNSAAGRNTLSYLIRCALPANHSITKTDSNGSSYTFAGGIGVSPEWENGTCGGDCQRWNSACLLAHVNTAGVHVPIWIVGQNAGLGWGQSAAYPNQEGTFFGNIFTTNEAGHTDAYYCQGPGFDKSVVDGRIGSAQVGAPYRDMFASGYCNYNGCLASDIATNGVPDGYKVCSMGDGAMSTWNQLVTVWRDNKSYNSSGTVVAGKTADGATVGYDFESSTNSWTSTATLSSSSDKSQTGTKSLKAVYSGGSGTVSLAGPANLSLAAGIRVRLYFRLDYNTNVSSITTWVKKSDGTKTSNTNDISRNLRGSWNAVSITVPSSKTGTQVGVDFATSGAFNAYVDGVSW